LQQLARLSTGGLFYGQRLRLSETFSSPNFTGCPPVSSRSFLFG